MDMLGSCENRLLSGKAERNIVPKPERVEKSQEGKNTNFISLDWRHCFSPSPDQ
jgi:hypothetical protein